MLSFTSEYYTRKRKRGRPSRRPDRICLGIISRRIAAGEVTIREVAMMFGVCPSTIRYWIPGIANAANSASPPRPRKRPDDASLAKYYELLAAAVIKREDMAARIGCSAPATYRWIPSRSYPRQPRGLQRDNPIRCLEAAGL